MWLVETAPGWRDAPDLTTGEHDILTAMLEMAWHDVKLDLDTIPPARRDEAIAAKLTAHEWITSDEDHLLSFHSVCLLIGIVDVDRVRRVMLRGVTIPAVPIPERWEAELASTDRRDRAYIKHPNPKHSKHPLRLLPVPSPPPCCPELDAEPTGYTLETLIAEISVPEGPAVDGAMAGWEAAVDPEGHEAAD